MKIRARVTDLWRESEGGWSENASWVDEVIFEVPDDATDATIRRRIKQELGIQGMKVDCWAGDEWSWRDGSIGAYAMIEEDPNPNPFSSDNTPPANEDKYETRN